jgi:hypothetical protein
MPICVSGVFEEAGYDVILGAVERRQWKEVFEAVGKNVVYDDEARGVAREAVRKIGEMRSFNRSRKAPSGNADDLEGQSFTTQISIRRDSMQSFKTSTSSNSLPSSLPSCN